MHAHPKHKTATPPGRRRRIAALGAAVLAVLIAAVSLTMPAEAQTTKPTIVLVHGAWADSTSWDKVARQLKDDGYRTVTPELGLNSVAEDVTIVSTALNKISGRKVLVSH
ncbi:esterase/lipase family protein, partial [Kribbella sp. VKM Ac-2568]|uniref:esterase/lipase family protein n=1 Tax=Kribbella sp. VKM Ac-2568 TaxID=2512219 RepID=UPI0010D6268D